MSVNLSFIGGAGWQFFDDSGNPLSGGKVYTYLAGTTTPVSTYTSWYGVTPNSNPIILDAAGRTPEQIWSTEGILYKYVVKTSTDVLIRTWDNIGGSVVASDLGLDLADTTDNAKGDALVGFKQSNASGFLTGAVGRTVNTKLQECVSVKDFGAVGNGVTDDRAAIQAALDASLAVYFPAGTYALATQIQIRSGQKLYGDGSASILLSTGTNVNILYGTSVSNIEITGLFFKGNATGTGTAGYAVRLETCSYANIHHCWFDAIGNTTGYAANISGDTCSYVVVDNNVFLGTSGGSQTGADVSLSYFGKQCIVTNNFSTSNHDAMVSLAAVGAVTEDTTNHVIANNIGVRKDTNTSRSGILVSYNDKAAYTVIANNLMYNWIWNGIYIQAATSNTLPSAGLTIANNIIRYCGGDNGGIGAGIYLSGTIGLTCVGNFIEYTSYNSAGTYRGNANDGVSIRNSANRITLASNTIRLSKGAGVGFSPLTGFEQNEISVVGNILFDNEAGGIRFNPNSATAFIRNVVANSNVIKQVANDADGISILPSGGAVAPINLILANNLISGVATPTTKSGITTNTGAPTAWAIRGNIIASFASGFTCSTFPADQIYGTECILDGNTIKDCVTAYTIGSTGVTQNGYAFNTTYINVTNRYSSANYSDAINLGNSNVELRRSAAPTGGTWRDGDRVTYTAPVAGGFIGVICTTAGSPGTWRTFGAIS